MVKAYLRYEQTQSFGVITATETQIAQGRDLETIVTPALEAVNLWHFRKGVLLKQLTVQSAVGTVTALVSIEKERIACGYSAGAIRIFNESTGDCDIAFDGGHRNRVSALAFLEEKSYLASGGSDTDIAVWDLVAQTGLFRLKGHKNEVTGIVFVSEHNSLVSCSKDATIRVWSLDSQHCSQVVTLHREVWSMCFSAQRKCLVTGSVDEEMQLYKMQETGEGDLLIESGTLKRRNRNRTQQIAFSSDSSFLGVLGQGKSFELYRLMTDKEVQKKKKRKLKRKREKAADTGAPIVEEDQPSTADEFQLEATINTKQKIKSFLFCKLRTGKVRIALALVSNAIEVHEWDGNESLCIHSLDAHGHRGDIRSLSLSSDDSMALSTSHNGIKLWNARNGSCLRSCSTGYGLCSAFVIGDRYAVIGTKTGDLEIFDVGSGSIVSTADAHESAVWSVATLPNGKGLVSVSGDKSMKFWEYSIEDSERGKALSLKQERSMKMPEDILCVAVDSQGKYISVGMIDSSIKVFFLDTLAFFLSLYGHKLPVLCLDISSDGTLLASGSSDKNIKVWGMDFGDCHKSLFAHSDSVTQVKFVPKTHYLFSTGKDRIFKYWDADKFELLLELKGHHAEIWTMAISSGGDFALTGSHDRSIRRWERTEEPFFLEEEKEKRLETMFDSVLDESAEKETADGASASIGQKSQQSVSAADTIIDALDIVQHELKRIEEHCREGVTDGHSHFMPNPLLLGMHPRQYLLRTIRRVRSSDIEQALILLPFNDAVKLLSHCECWLKSSTAVELSCKLVMTLVRIHLDKMSSTRTLRPMLTQLQQLLMPSLKGIKDMLGTNMVAMQFVRRNLQKELQT